MKLSDNLRRRGWRKSILGDHIALSNGKGITSSQMEADKPIPVYGSGSIIGYTDKPLVFYDTIVIGRVGACGTVQIAKAPCWISDNAMYVTQIKPRLDFHFLFFLLNYLRLGTLVSRTTQPSLPQGPILNHDFPLPPLPVQERIVQILQKADEIRRKRKEALELADKVLPALFLEMFGDPATNPKGWPTEPIGALVHFDTAQIKPKPGETYLYLAPEHIESNTGNYTGPHPTDGREIGSAKHPFTSEHVLYCKLRPYLNKVVLPHTSGICSTELVPLRPGPKFLREFLGIYLRLPFFVATAVQKSQGTKMPRFGPELMKREEMIVPPIPLQQSFCLQVSQLMEVSKRVNEGLSLSCSSFNGLLSRAFTGELTAEWEAANAGWIAAQQTLYERLPRLLILALIAEKAKRARRSAEVLVTALMKYVFLFQMEGSASHRRLYHFVPYLYGPFAKELYIDLEKLQEEGLVQVESNPEEDKMKITLTDQVRMEALLAELPEDLKEDAATVISTYGELDHNSLLEVVYEKYPAYAKKSRLRQRRA